MSWSLSRSVPVVVILSLVWGLCIPIYVFAAEPVDGKWGSAAQNAAPQHNSASSPNLSWYNRAVGYFGADSEKNTKMPSQVSAPPASGFWQPADAPQMLSRDAIRASGPVTDNWFHNSSNGAAELAKPPVTKEPLRAPLPPVSAPLSEYPNLANVPIQPPSNTPPSAWADRQKELEFDRNQAQNVMQQDWLQTLPVNPDPSLAPSYTPPPAPALSPDADHVANNATQDAASAPLVSPASEDKWERTPIVIMDQVKKQDLPITANDSFDRNARGKSARLQMTPSAPLSVSAESNLPWGSEFGSAAKQQTMPAAVSPISGGSDLPWLSQPVVPPTQSWNPSQPMPYLQSGNYPPIGSDLSVVMPPAAVQPQQPMAIPMTQTVPQPQPMPQPQTLQHAPLMAPVPPLVVPPVNQSPISMAIPPLVPPKDANSWNYVWGGNNQMPLPVIGAIPNTATGTVVPYDPIGSAMMNYQQRMEQSAPFTSGAPYMPYGKNYGWWYNNPNWATYRQNPASPLTSPLSNDQFAKPPVSLTKPVATIYFKDESTALDANDQKVLKQLAQWFDNRGGGLRVVGHSSSRTKDMDATKQKMRNYKLSLDRAENVSKKLQSLGVAKNKINVTARGDADKQFAETMPSGDAWNRRVEIYWDMF